MEQGEWLADMASQNSIVIERAERGEHAAGYPTSPSVELLKNEAVELSARAADLLADE